MSERLAAVSEPEHAAPYIQEPKVHLVTDMEFEPAARASNEKWLGSLALKGEEVRGERDDEVNIAERLSAAREGSAEALAWLKVNISAAVFEAMFKEGYVGQTYMDRTVQGELSQFGQTSGTIYANALNLRQDRNLILQRITEAEALNRHLIEAALKAGWLKSHYYVVFSLVPDGLSEEELGPDGEGYWIDSLALNIQATTELANGRIKTETGFMAGVEADDSDDFAARLAKRYDFAALAKLYKRWGLTPPRTAEAGIRFGLLIHKDEMPNGVVDPMRWMDEAADEVLGRDIERKPEDYLGLQLESRRKENSLKHVREAVLKDLLIAAETEEFSDADPMDVVQLLWELVREHTLNDSYHNSYINSNVFGRTAAADIELARYHLQQGDTKLAQSYMKSAASKATVSGCGGGAGRRFRAGLDGEEEDTALDRILGKDKFGRRWFRCSKGHLNIRHQKDQLLEKCQHKGCTARVSCK